MQLITPLPLVTSCFLHALISMHYFVQFYRILSINLVLHPFLSPFQLWQRQCPPALMLPLMLLSLICCHVLSSSPLPLHPNGTASSFSIPCNSCPFASLWLLLVGHGIGKIYLLQGCRSYVLLICWWKTSNENVNNRSNIYSTDHGNYI